VKYYLHRCRIDKQRATLVHCTGVLSLVSTAAAAALQGASSGVLCTLLKAGADPLAVNKQRLTPGQLAQRAAEDKLKAHTDKQSQDQSAVVCASLQ
jgi:hypothetical protein